LFNSFCACITGSFHESTKNQVWTNARHNQLRSEEKWLVMERHFRIDRWSIPQKFIAITPWSIIRTSCLEVSLRLNNPRNVNSHNRSNPLVHLPQAV
jgi:hypothetical protein